MPEAFFTIPTKTGKERSVFEDLKKRFGNNVIDIQYCNGADCSIILQIRYGKNQVDGVRRSIVEITELNPLSYVIKKKQEYIKIP